MTGFLYPLGFLFAAVLPVIVLMYLLRLKRQKVKISSILLWHKSLQDLQANAPFQKLRNNLLLWLQLLIALLLVIALARPMMNLAMLKGQSLIVLVDTSASMKAHEQDKTRIDEAREALQAMVKNMKRGDEMMIVGFDREARVLQTFTSDQSLLLHVADGLQARDSITSIRDALLLARTASEARAVPVTSGTGKAANVQVVILSDGAISDLDHTPENLPPVRYVPIGTPGDNAGIVSLDLRETFERESDRQIFTTVENFGKQHISGILQCYLNGQIIDAKEVSLDAGANTAVIFSNLKDKSGQLELRLACDDKLDTDNVAYGVLTPRQQTKVLLVGNQNTYLEKMLGTNKNYQLFEQTPDKYAPSNQYDVTIFDNFAPKQLPPGRYLMFNALPPLEGFAAVGEPLASPAIVDWNRVHPLTRYVNFESINIARAMHVQTPSWVQSLAECEISPLIFCFERDQRQIVVVAFDLFQSDWPLRVSFPIFINNALSYLAQSSGQGGQFTYTTGAAIPFTADQAPAQYAITSPSGATRKFDIAKGATAYYSQTNEIGLYQVKSGKDTRQFSVNLLSREESNLAPRDSLMLNDRVVQGTASVLKENHEIWPWFALGALGVLLLEWIIYCRRAWL